MLLLSNRQGHPTVPPRSAATKQTDLYQRYRLVQRPGSVAAQSWDAVCPTTQVGQQTALPG